ncbi:phosphoribosyl transferase domain protein [Nemania abortiva]|nr:phosphoribosyl transferase domain protein [Nemania abortiva]
MATLDHLKRALRREATGMAKQPLSDAQYSVAFDIFRRGSVAYQDFVIPQLSRTVTPLFNSRTDIAVLEIGPGPKSILEHLPNHMRRQITNYTAFEPNILFATSLEEWLCPTSKSPLPGLEGAPDIRRVPFALDGSTERHTGAGESDESGKYDLILFCHSMYGMKPHHKFIERALKMLDQRVEGGMVVVFHRQGTLDFAGLVCHRTASFPTGEVSVPNDNTLIDSFSPLIAGFVMQDSNVDGAVRMEWRKICRALGHAEEGGDKDVLFSAPEVMMVFTKHATALAELTALVPLVEGDRVIKNREARLHRPAAIVRPTEVEHIQHCVRWAIKHETGLTILGGGHSGHCLQPSVVSVDMGAFNQVHVLAARESEEDETLSPGSLVVVEAGCKTGDIIRKTMEAGLTVPLGSRPSVGAGLWLQGGIGHLARLQGLACDTVVGAVVVSVDSGQVLLVGNVPSQHQPAGAVRPGNEEELLWALKGAGTNFAIVISVTFKASAALNYLTRNKRYLISGWRYELDDIDYIVDCELPRNCSADAYLYYDDANERCLGIATFESSTDTLSLETSNGTAELIERKEVNAKIVDGVGLFETEMYMSGMHGGHGGGKTSSFKRCLFLDSIGRTDVADLLIAAIQCRPSPLCYIHFLHGGGAIRDIAADATAFGCRDWDFACVLTGVWPRDEDGTEIAKASVSWVYDFAMRLLPFSTGVYGADLGPDPRDIPLAAKAFGRNLPRLSRLKSKLDPHRVLAYACPLPEPPTEPELIILVTGESCAGKDFCAPHFASVFNNSDRTPTTITARVVSISDETKRDYAEAVEADLDRLLHDRAYKEQHRSALTAFFENQVEKQPYLLEEHFLNVVRSASVDDLADVIIITGMREDAPVAMLSYFMPATRLLEVRIQASEEARRFRGGGKGNRQNEKGSNKNQKDNHDGSKSTTMNYRPDFIFNNETAGDEAVKKFAEQNLLPFFHEDLQRLANMVRLISDFPREGIDFRHVLDISQQPGGLSLCTSLFRKHFSGDWDKVGAVVCCEAGGFVFAPALSTLVNVPLALIREAGKLPPPTLSVTKYSSHISSSASRDSAKERIEIGQDVVPKGVPVVVIDDVLATGKTLCAVLELLIKTGVDVEHITVMTVAEFPFHRGRKLLHESGFGRVGIKSLLVFDGA